MRPLRTERERLLSTDDAIAFCVGLLALGAGIVVLAVTPGIIASYVGMCLLGVAAITFVALAFLLIGESEDREHHGGSHLSHPGERSAPGALIGRRRR